MEEFVAEHSVMHNLLRRINVKIQAKIKARQGGTSRRRKGFNRRIIERDHGEGHQRLVTDFFLMIQSMMKKYSEQGIA